MTVQCYFIPLITYGVSIIPERPPPKPPEKDGASSSISASVKKTKKHKLNLTLKGGNFALSQLTLKNIKTTIV